MDLSDVDLPNSAMPDMTPPLRRKCSCYHERPSLLSLLSHAIACSGSLRTGMLILPRVVGLMHTGASSVIFEADNDLCTLQ